MLYTVKTIYNNSNKTPKKPLQMAFFVIKKKTVKKAVDRNRIKRRAKKAFLDAIIQIKENNPLFSLYSIYPKKIIFFLEHDMIHHTYSDIVSNISKDLVRIIKN